MGADFPLTDVAATALSLHEHCKVTLRAGGRRMRTLSLAHLLLAEDFIPH